MKIARIGIMTGALFFRITTPKVLAIQPAWLKSDNDFAQTFAVNNILPILLWLADKNLFGVHLVHARLVSHRKRRIFPRTYSNLWDLHRKLELPIYFWFHFLSSITQGYSQAAPTLNFAPAPILIEIFYANIRRMVSGF